MIIRTHDDYVALAHQFRYSASHSPNSPWTTIDLPPASEAISFRWSGLATWLRSTERSFYDPAPFQLGTLTKCLIPTLGETFPHNKLLIELLGAARTSLDPAYALELAALSLRAVYFGNHFRDLLDRFLLEAEAHPEPSRLRWLKEIGATVSERDVLTRIQAALPASATDLDRHELALDEIRLDSDATVAIRRCEELLASYQPTAPDLVSTSAPGSTQHRQALVRLRLLQEHSFRSNAIDATRAALERSRTVFHEASSIGLPGSSEIPPHDLSGFDLFAQVSVADWVYSAVATDASVGNEVLFRAFMPTNEVNVAASHRRRVLRGRFPTDYDGVLDFIDDGARLTLENKSASAREKFETAVQTAIRIRCFALWTFAMDALAQFRILELGTPDARDDLANLARDAVQAATSAGEPRLVEEAARAIARLPHVSGRSLIENLPHVRIVERRARLAVMQELVVNALDGDLAPFAHLAADEARTGPFSMQPRLDVQRAAIRASSQILYEAAGLADDTQFGSISGTIVDTWFSIVQADANPLVVNEISDALSTVLRLPPARFSEALAARMLDIATSLPKDGDLIHKNAWPNFVRPAIEFVIFSQAQSRDVSLLRTRLLALIPEPHFASQVTSDEGLTYPPDQMELLPLTYRCLLQEPPDRELVHLAVDRMTAYCNHFADGSKRKGLRMPIRPDLALGISTFGYPHDQEALLAVLLTMCASRPLGAAPRGEAIDAVLEWLRVGPPTDPLKRLNVVERAAPRLADALFDELSEEPRPKAQDALEFGDPDSNAGALLVLCTTLVTLDRGRSDAPVRLARLASVAEKLSRDRSVGVRGSARNVSATLVLEPLLEEAQRTRLLVLFLSSQYEQEQDVVIAALRGFRWALERRDLAPIDPSLLPLMALHLSGRAQSGARVIQQEARLALRALRETAGGAAAAVDRALNDTRFSEGDERAWRRHHLAALERHGRGR